MFDYCSIMIDAKFSDIPAVKIRYGIKHWELRDSDHGRSGFVLVIVLFVIAIISLLVTGVIIEARQYTQATASMVGRANAEALAEAGVVMIKAAIIQTLSGPSNGTKETPPAQARQPVICSMPGDAIAVISVRRDEDSVSLNTDSAESISTLLAHAGADAPLAAELAANIVEFRNLPSTSTQSAQVTSGHPDILNHGPFVTVMELDQVKGMTPDLFKAAIPYITILPHPTVTPDVMRIIALARTTPRPLARSLIEMVANLQTDRMLVHVEVLGKDGGAFVREAVLSLVAGKDPVSIVEWRQGFARYQEVLAKAMILKTNHTAIFSECDQQP